MPALVAVVTRTIIQAIVTTGILTAAQAFLIPIINKCILEVSEFFGATEEEAKDIVANEILQFAETAGILVLTLRTKMPTLIAERLGFTSKGWVLRKLSPTLAAKVGGKAVTGAVAVAVTTAEVTKIAETVAVSRGISASVVTTVYKGIMSFVGVTALVAMTIGNFIDFANWQGAYQKTFEKLFTALGFPPDTPMPKSKAVSADTWSKIYSIVETLNPESIAFPWDGVTKPYSRNNLADAVDHFAANLALQGIDTTYKNVWGLLLPCIKLKSGTNTSLAGSLNTTTSASTIVVPKIQVFTGVLSQGVLGVGLEFQARPDDMIESAKELVDAASNNLAPFLSALASRVTYQVKIVSSITTKDGFVQKGSVRQVISSYDTKGNPKYKTVVNKFATLDINVLTDKGTRVKIATIVLGPVDSVKFQVGQQTISNVDSTLRGLVTTSDINDIKGVSTVNPITITTPPQQVTQTQTTAPSTPQVTQTTPVTTGGNKPEGFRFSYNESGTDIYTANDGNRYYADGSRYVEKVVNRVGLYQVEKSNTPDGYEVIFYSPGVTPNASLLYPGAPAPSSTFPSWKPTKSTSSQTTTSTSGTKPGANASTLAEWYSANGWALPSIEVRSTLYQNLGLGQAAYYVGSAEQNTKLLTKLKSQ